MEELEVFASKENLEKVLVFIENILSPFNFSIKSKLQLELAIEEIFVNISSYSYDSDNGKIKIQSKIDENPLKITINFLDNGYKFNPLEVKTPDTSENIDNRKIGGLGLFLVKKNVDNINYQYKDKRNILSIEKILK